MKKAIILSLALVLTIGLLVPASVMAAAVDPVLVDPWTSGNAEFECSQVGTCDFAYKVEPWDEGDPSGDYSHAGNTITITAYANAEGEYDRFDWQATLPVSTVIVVAGPKAFVYSYDPAVSSDTGLVAPDGKAVSHATFCWDRGGPPTIPGVSLWTSLLGVAALMGSGLVLVRRKRVTEREYML